MRKATQRQNIREDKPTNSKAGTHSERVPCNSAKSKKSRYITKIEQITELGKAEATELKKVTDKFAF